MKKFYFILFFSSLLGHFSFGTTASDPNENHLNTLATPGEYRWVVEGFDWGPAVNKVILTLDESVKEAHAAHYQVFANGALKVQKYLLKVLQGHAR
jgi:hypothetical protein